MKVLVINTVVTDPNGIAQVIFNLNEHIDHSDLQVDLVSINEPEKIYYDKIQKFGGKIYVIERSISGSIKYICRLSSLIRKNKYDAVHAHGNSSTLLLEMLAAWVGGCKKRIAHSHNTTCDNVTLHRWLSPLFNALSTDRFACGIEAGRWMFGKKSFTVINNGVDTDKFAFDLNKRTQIRKALDVDEDILLAGHVGFFNTQKNQSFLLDIFDELIRQNNKYRLVLVGDGPDHDIVHKKIKDLNLEQYVICTGLVHNVVDYLSAMDMIIMPSLYEGLPVALIEEQANGLQCFISDTITQEVDKTGNINFIPLEIPAKRWAKTIEDTYKQNFDRGQYSSDAISNIAKAGYSIQTESKKLLEYYKRK